MGKSVTIDKFFQRKRVNELDTADILTSSTRSNNNDLPFEISPKRFKNIEIEEIDLNSLERDPGLRRKIWENHHNQREEIRRTYLNLKAYQPILGEYQLNKNIKHPRRFQSTWYDKFPWLEYSPAKDKVYCFPCFIFNKPSGCSNQNAFTVDGFDNWKKVRNGKACAFLGHIRKDNVSSPHRNAEKACDDLMNQPQHISRRFDNFNVEQVANNRLRLKAHIHVVRLLALQGIPFRGHDEKSSSSNRGNFLEFLDVLTMYNESFKGNCKSSKECQVYKS
ncbi:uncharacterized protein [Primulina huaijiensis]|uniref:uncharacterized protein n=1 Tax=Primulina huaijiensis TaxID=1492673 RepID=UPI003CC72C8E